MLDLDTGEVVEKTLEYEAEKVKELYSALPSPVVVGIEATGSMHWFLKLMEELGINCQVGHPAKIRVAEPGLDGAHVDSRTEPAGCGGVAKRWRFRKKRRAGL